MSRTPPAEIEPLRLLRGDCEGDMASDGDGEDKGSKRASVPRVLKGLVICCSGALSKLRRDMEALIKKHGGASCGSISGSTTHLVITADFVASDHTSKIRNAKEKSESRVCVLVLTRSLRHARARRHPDRV